MVELHPHADRGVSLGYPPVDSQQRGLLAQRDQARRGQHRHLAGAERERRVVVADVERDGRGQAGFQGHPGTVRIHVVGRRNRPGPGQPASITAETPGTRPRSTA